MSDDLITLPSGVPAVITLAAPAPVTMEGISIEDACLQLEEAGAAVVGLNCARGPKSIMPLMKKIRNVCKVGWISIACSFC